MKIYKFKAWRWSDTLIYGAGFIFSVMASATAAGVLSRAGRSIPETYCTLLVPLLWALITWRLYATRRAFVDGIAFVTYQGVSVVPNGADWLIDSSHDLAEAIEDALEFWQKHYAEWDRLEEALNGLVLVVHDGPVSDPRHGIKDKRGLTWQGTIAVDGQLPRATFFAVVEHEVCHVLMSRMGEKRDHHVAMAAAGWRYA